VNAKFYKMLIWGFLGLLLGTSCSEEVERKCELACAQFLRCTKKAFHREVTPALEKMGSLACMAGCTTHNSEILECFDTEGHSCKSFGLCVKEIGSLE